MRVLPMLLQGILMKLRFCTCLAHADNLGTISPSGQSLAGISGNMAWWTLLAVSCLFGFSLTSAAQSSVRGEQPAVPQWRVEVRSALGGSPVPARSPVSQGEIRGPLILSLRFADNNTIVASFVVREGDVKLSTRKPSDENLPLRLRGILLDASTGKILATPIWPTLDRTSAIIAAHDDKLLVKNGDELLLFGGPDLSLVKKITLPIAEHYVFPSSPTGKHALAFPFVKPGTWFWIDAQTLEVRAWQDQAKAAQVAISDTQIAMIEINPSLDCCYLEQIVQAKSINGGWKKVASVASYDLPQEFITNDALYLHGYRGVSSLLIDISRGDTFVLPVQGPVGPPRGKLGWGDAIPSGGGRRFVLPGSVMRGAHPALDISGHVVLKKLLVFDLSSLDKPITLAVKPKIEDRMLFALSPDGSRLAVLNKETILVFELPPAQ